MKKKLNENMTKSDVNKEIKTYLDTKDFESRISKIIRDRINKDKEIEDKVVEITKNVLIQLYKTLWTKRSFWKDNLSNKSN
jgi:hypothetical protein